MEFHGDSMGMEKNRQPNIGGGPHHFLALQSGKRMKPSFFHRSHPNIGT